MPEPDTLERRIAEARAWYEHRGRTYLPWRGPCRTSGSMRPRRALDELFWATTLVDDLRVPWTETHQMVEEVVATRRKLLAKEHRAPMAKGGTRLVLYQPHWSTAFELSWDASEGFFGRHDDPPWDLWVGVHRASWEARPVHGQIGVVAWVPEEWRERADAGIHCNPEDCIVWIEPADVRLWVNG